MLESLVTQAMHGRGISVETLAQHAADKIISIGDQSHPLVRAQAQAFKAHIQAVILETLKQAVREERITIAHRLNREGHGGLARLLND